MFFLFQLCKCICLQHKVEYCLLFPASRVTVIISLLHALWEAMAFPRKFEERKSVTCLDPTTLSGLSHHIVSSPSHFPLLHSEYLSPSEDEWSLGYWFWKVDGTYLRDLDFIRSFHVLSFIFDSFLHHFLLSHFHQGRRDSMVLPLITISKNIGFIYLLLEDSWKKSAMYLKKIWNISFLFRIF